MNSGRLLAMLTTADMQVNKFMLKEIDKRAENTSDKQPELYPP